MALDLDEVRPDTLTAKAAFCNQTILILAQSVLTLASITLRLLRSAPVCRMVTATVTVNTPTSFPLGMRLITVPVRTNSDITTSQLLCGRDTDRQPSSCPTLCPKVTSAYLYVSKVCHCATRQMATLLLPPRNVERPP